MILLKTNWADEEAAGWDMKRAIKAAEDLLEEETVEEIQEVVQV